MKAVSARAARASISALIDAAEAGESTLIIRNSQAAAVIGPVPPERELGYDSHEVRWYRLPGSLVRIGFTGPANAHFLARPREERAHILDVVASVAGDRPIVLSSA